jgi:NifU-like protein involved in Fe-S cluster formation
MLENVEEKALELYREVMREKGYSDAAIELILDPKDMRICEFHNAFGLIDGYCGDTMMIWIRVENGVIVDASFHTDGCSDSIAAGGMAVRLAKGKTLDEAMEISARTILDALGNLPSEGGHCAELASNTLMVAISDWRDNNG